MYKYFDTKNLLDICKTNDVQAFHSYLQNKFQFDCSEIVLQNDILKTILFSESIFHSLLKTTTNDNVNQKFFAHPLLYPLLNFALLHPAIYERQLFEILDFGIKHNLNISKQLSCDNIMQNGNLVKADMLIGRAVIYNATEAIDGNEELFIKLNELNNSVRAIKTKQLNLNGGYSRLSVRMFSLLKIMINTYQPDENFKRNFADKILQRMERKLKHTPICSKTYNRIYKWVNMERRMG